VAVVGVDREEVGRLPGERDIGQITDLALAVGWYAPEAEEVVLGGPSARIEEGPDQTLRDALLLEPLKVRVARRRLEPVTPELAPTTIPAPFTPKISSPRTQPWRSQPCSWKLRFVLAK